MQFMFNYLCIVSDMILLSWHNTVLCLNIGTLKTINFSFRTNGKLMVLGAPILKQYRVYILRWMGKGQCFLPFFFSKGDN